MSLVGRPVVVGIDDSPSTEAVLKWAVDDARSRHVPLRLVHAHHWRYVYARSPMYADIPDADLQLSGHFAEQLIALAIEHAQELDAGVEVDGEILDGDPAEVLVRESHFAGALVLGSRHLKALGSIVLGSVGAATAARAACPAVVVRGSASLIDEGAAVVVGVDGTKASETVLGYGFEHASRHRAPLRAVLCWRPHLAATLGHRADLTPNRADAWLSETLAGWREKYPDVVVHPQVTSEHPVAGLVLASTAQCLLVVGNHGHHAMAGTLLGSVSQGVLHHATCPVAVVPTHRQP